MGFLEGVTSENCKIHCLSVPTASNVPYLTAWTVQWLASVISAFNVHVFCEAAAICGSYICENVDINGHIWYNGQQIQNLQNRMQNPQDLHKPHKN